MNAPSFFLEILCLPQEHEGRRLKMRKAAVFASVLFLAFWLAGGLSQERKDEPETSFDPLKTWPVEELKEDFSVLRSSIEEGHAGLYRYSTKEEMDRLFDDAFSALTEPLTELEFMRLLAPLVAALGCGHTGYQFSSGLSAYAEKLPTYLPFGLKFIGRKAYLLRNFSDSPDLPMGGELLSINGRAMPDIIDRMLLIIPSDGRIQTAKFRKMESPRSFNMFYTIVFGLTEQYALEFRSPQDHALKNLTVPGKTRAEINRLLEERYPESAKSLPPISLDYKRGIPVLSIRTFGSGAYTQAKISYPGFLERTFQELNDKNMASLIIDLRDNGGGEDAFGKILFAHLTDKPFQYYAALEIRKTEFDFFKCTNIPAERRSQTGGRFQKNARGWYDVLFHPNVGTQQPISPMFKGKVFVLINGRSFSASGETTSPMHYHKKAVFIGEECGAGYYGNNSGFMPTVTLPHTKIRVVIPLIRYTMAVDGYPADRGIIPEYPVEPTIEDLLQNKDTVMEFAIDLVSKAR